MIVCKKCGTKNNDKFNCCYNCGTPLKNNFQKDDIPDDKDISINSSFNNAENKYNNNIEENNNDLLQDYEENIEEERISQEEYMVDNRNEPEYEYHNEDFSQPLHSYQKKNSSTKPTSKSINNSNPSKSQKRAETTRKNVAFGIVLALVFLFVMWGTVQFLNGLFSRNPSDPSKPTDNPATDSSSKLSASYEYNKIIEKYGDVYYIINIKTNATSVWILNQEYPVTDNQASIKLSSVDIYKNYSPENVKKGDVFNAKDIPATITADGYDNYVFYFSINDVETPIVPINLISPVDTNSTVYKSETIISFKTEKNVTVYLNNVDKTAEGLNPETGIFTFKVPTPPSDSIYRYGIKIESSEYMTREFIYEITRSTDKDPNVKTDLTIDNIRIDADESSTATITGIYTGEKNTLIFSGKNINDFNIVSIAFDDSGNGAFTAVLKLDEKYLGMYEIDVISKEDSSLTKTIYIKNMSEALGGFTKYSTSSWSVFNSYSELKSNESRHNGQRFLIEGTVIKSEKTDFGTALTIKIRKEFTHNEPDEEKIVYVELFEENSQYTEGKIVKIFANRSGSQNDIPRFLSVKSNILNN